ncbi:alpha/beta hydrolase [Micromonospora echinospora]|uniref:alpha/beta fold hydrolase n=1 Tax=Micromonospora echinospora TaxID=1877 RepID=UPI0033C57654
MGVVANREAQGRVAGDAVELAFGFWPGRGRPIVALHGITASYVNFVGIAERLAGRRPLLALDLRGRGGSDKPDGPHGMSQHARDVAAAMEAFGLDDCVVVGHSMGAFAAVALAAEHPDRVAGVMMVDGGLPLTAPPGVDPAALLDVVLGPQLARLRQEFASREEYHDYWRALPAFPADVWGPWVHAYLDYDLGGAAPHLRPRASEAAIRADYLDTLDADLLRRRLAAITVPVTLLTAEEGFYPDQPPLYPDAVVQAEGGAVSRFAHQRISGTTHYTVALADHGATSCADALVAFAEQCGR